MKTGVKKYWNWGVSVLVGIGIFLFWYCWYPHALSYQEQYQLFLWTGDYLIEKCSIPGGFADWIGEFIVQFYYVEWLGALLLAMVFVIMQRLCLRLLQNHGDSPHDSEPDTCSIAIVAYGRYQCDVVAAHSNNIVTCTCLLADKEKPYSRAALAYPLPFMDRSPYPPCGILACRSSGVDIRHYPHNTDRMETSLDSRLATGSDSDVICLVPSTMALAASDDRTDILPYTTPLSTAVRIRQGYVRAYPSGLSGQE